MDLQVANLLLATVNCEPCVSIFSFIKFGSQIPLVWPIAEFRSIQGQ